MRLRDLLQESWRALSANKMRSLLTVLGIVIGISSVITLTSMVDGISRSMVSGVGGNMTKVVNIYPMKDASRDDFTELGERMPEYERILLSNQIAIGMSHGSASYSPQPGVTGVEVGFNEASSAKLNAGRFFTKSDEEQLSRVIILGGKAVKGLFGNDESHVVGEEVFLGDDAFTVVGVLEGDESSSEYGSVYVPLATMETRLDAGSSYTASAITKEEFSEQEGAALSAKTAETFTEITGGGDPEEAVTVFTMTEMLAQVNTLMGGFGVLLGGIAAISLLVGGIGIMNMMLTNVTERTREIGLRKALGARPRDIIRQFLIESVVLTIVGGILGIVFGFIGASIISVLISILQPAMAFTPAISMNALLLSVGVSAGIGIVFGLYPARRAARLDPIEALRFQ